MLPKNAPHQNLCDTHTTQHPSRYCWKSKRNIVLCCAVPCRAVLCRAVLCCAMPLFLSKGFLRAESSFFHHEEPYCCCCCCISLVRVGQWCVCVCVWTRLERTMCGTRARCGAPLGNNHRPACAFACVCGGNEPMDRNETIPQTRELPIQQQTIVGVTVCTGKRRGTPRYGLPGTHCWRAFANCSREMPGVSNHRCAIQTQNRSTTIRATIFGLCLILEKKGNPFVRSAQIPLWGGRLSDARPTKQNQPRLPRNTTAHQSVKTRALPAIGSHTVCRFSFVAVLPLVRSVPFRSINQIVYIVLFLPFATTTTTQ